MALQNGATAADVAQLVSLLEYEDKDAIYWYAGYNIDYNNFLSSFEFTRYNIKNTMFPESTGWYLSLGYRFDNVTVNLRRESLSREKNYNKAGAIQHPILNATARAVHDSIVNSNLIDGIGASLRYDFHSNAAFKLDYFTGENDQIQDGDFQLLSVGIDVVF